MDAQKIVIAERCLRAAEDGTMTFPDIVGTLARAGFEGYLVDYRRNTATYYLPGGDSVVLEKRSSARTVAPDFDPAGVAERIGWAQSGAPDYAYQRFSDQVTALGCAGYIVSFPGRRVLYFGRTAETHVEHFPQEPAPSSRPPVRP